MYFKNNQFVSKNKLYFWWKNYEFLKPTEEDEKRVWFIVGTCKGMYIIEDSICDIWAITNSDPGNGHFDDVLEWFEFFCKNGNRDLLITRIENMKFRDHLLNKRGFIEHGPAGVKKIFRQL